MVCPGCERSQGSALLCSTHSARSTSAAERQETSSIPSADHRAQLQNTVREISQVSSSRPQLCLEAGGQKKVVLQNAKRPPATPSKNIQEIRIVAADTHAWHATLRVIANSSRSVSQTVISVPMMQPIALGLHHTNLAVLLQHLSDCITRSVFFHRGFRPEVVAKAPRNRHTTAC